NVWCAAVPGPPILRAFVRPTVKGPMQPSGWTIWASVSRGRLPLESLALYLRGPGGEARLGKHKDRMKRMHFLHGDGEQARPVRNWRDAEVPECALHFRLLGYTSPTQHASETSRMTQPVFSRDEISRRGEPVTLSADPLCCDGLLGWSGRCSSIGDKR